MKELRDVASRFGLRLQGASLKSRPDAIDRPMIVFLRRGEHGHYLVVRPVGHTGRLVQLIDAGGPPEVVDVSTLLGSPLWTGMALLPGRIDWPLAICIAATVGAVLATVVGFLTRNAGSRQSPSRMAHGLLNWSSRMPP